MGRKSKLSDAQWEQIGKRLLAGEKAADLAREFKVSRATISERFSRTTEKVKTVANQLVTTEQAMESLSVSEQVSAISLASRIRATMEHMTTAAEYGSAISSHLLGVAHSQRLKIDDVDPMKSLDVIKGMSALIRTANDAAVVPTALINGSKDAVKQVQKEDPVLPVKIVIQVEDASVPEPAAQ